MKSFITCHMNTKYSASLLIAWFAAFLLFSTTLCAQKHDYIWSFGTKGSPIVGDDYGLIIMDFNQDPPIFSVKSYLNSDSTYRIWFGFNSMSICDSFGIHKFYTGGLRYPSD